MKDNKVLSAIYGIALFVALIGAVGLLYNAIELLSYTTFYVDTSHGKILSDFYDVQKSIATALLVASIIGIIGIAAGVAYIFVKKPLLKIICLSFIAAAVAAIVAGIIVVSSSWDNYYIDFMNEHTSYGGLEIDLLPSSLAAEFALYSQALTSVIQSLVCFVVIAAVTVYDFIKDILNKKKDGKTKEVVVEEITE